MNYEVSQRGIDLIKKWEGFRARPYLCSAKKPTIGYGSTRYFDIVGAPLVTLKDAPITEERANELLVFTVDDFWFEIEHAIQVPLEQYQVDALASFAYNVGVSAFTKSTLLRMLNQNDFKGAEAQFARWNKADGKVSQGLTNRRVDETNMFAGRA